MITHSIVRTLPHPQGWTADYHLAGCRDPVRLCDALGRPIPYPTAESAKIAAHEALLAAMERADAVFIDPHPNQFWLAVHPKTRLGLVVQAKKKFEMVRA